VFGIEPAREGADTFLISVHQAAPIAVVLPEMAHVLGSKPKFEMLEEFHASLPNQEAGAARPVKFMKHLVGTILERQLKQHLKKVS
jgi:hypothetical protein